MVSNFFKAAVFGLVFCVAGTVQAEIFGISSNYNNVFFGDYYGRNGDIEGHAAIQGNVDVQNYAFGSGQQNLHPSSMGPTLVVGGNVKASSTDVYDGDAYIQGTLTPQAGKNKWNTLGTKGTGKYNTIDRDYQGTPGTVYVKGTQDADLDYQYQEHTDAAIPFDFDLAKQQLQKVSSELSSLEITAVARENGNNWVIDLTKSTGLQVVTMAAETLNEIAGTGGCLLVNAGADTTLVLNVTGNGELNFKGGAIIINGRQRDEDPDNLANLADFNGSNILINAADITSVNLTNAEVNASLIALNADFDVQHGHFSGQVFGASASTTNGGEFHAFYLFNDQHIGTPTPSGNATPEPATLAIFGLSLTGLGFGQLRRKVRVA